MLIMLCHACISIFKCQLVMTCDIFALSNLWIPLIHLFKQLIDIQRAPFRFFEYFDNLDVNLRLPLNFRLLYPHRVSDTLLCYFIFIFVLQSPSDSVPNEVSLKCCHHLLSLFWILLILYCRLSGTSLIIFLSIIFRVSISIGDSCLWLRRYFKRSIFI